MCCLQLTDLDLSYNQLVSSTPGWLADHKNKYMQTRVAAMVQHLHESH